MTFQASDFKGNHFLNLLDDDHLSITPTYIKSGSWLMLIDYSNSLYIRVIRVIINYTLIGEYQLRFFPKENFNCLYRNYPIQSRYHILHKCKKYNKYWNSDRELFSHFIIFLEFNSRAFSFHKDITY